MIYGKKEKLHLWIYDVSERHQRILGNVKLTNMNKIKQQHL